MKRIVTMWLLAACLPALFLSARAVTAASKDLGNGFFDHGVATPISNHRGTVATIDGAGRNVVLSWLNDHRGGYELLLIDVEAGKAEEHPMPFPPGDHPFASILSSGNKFYTHFNSLFVEFDPTKRAFTFCQKTKPQMAMSMTEDDNGVIWSATYPNSGLVSFDPQTREFKDHGYLYQQNWAQYPRSVAADDAGWVYLGIGSTLGQIIAFDPRTGIAMPLVPEEQRVHGYCPVDRDMDGKVYARSVAGKEDNWLMLHNGAVTSIGKRDKPRPKVYIAGSQGLFHATFPDGKRIQIYSLVDRQFAVEDPKTKQTKAFSFGYKSEGAEIMGVAAAPDGTICGGTAFPMRFFSFDPRKDEWINREAYGQWNTVARQGERLFVGAYSSGSLLEWNPFRPWVATKPNTPDCNPLHRLDCAPTIIRPHKLLAHPDGKTIVMGGTPAYGYTGGGLLFWDRETGKHVLLTHEEILPDHSTLSLAALPSAKLLGGTTTSPGTGGQRKAKEAELYVIDMATKRIEWHQAVFPGAQGYTDLFLSPEGLVYGFVDQQRFFVLDPTTRKVVHEQLTETAFGRTVSHQGPRVFVPGPQKGVYVLFNKSIARIEPLSFQINLIAQSPVRIGFGGDYLDGRIYFGDGSHLYSFQLPH